MSSYRIVSTPHATVRVVTSQHGDVSSEAIEIVLRAIDRGEAEALARSLEPGHLFVTILAGDSIEMGPDGQTGVACYRLGVEEILVAGLRPDDPDLTDQDWSRELFCSTAHEYIHHLQALEGRLTEPDDDACEQEAERLAVEWTTQDWRERATRRP